MKYKSCLIVISCLISLYSLGMPDAARHLVTVERTIIQHTIPPRVYQLTYSGICINADCSIVMTVHHPQALKGTSFLRVEGKRVQRIMSLASANENSVNQLTDKNGRTTYHLDDDVSLLYLKHSLSGKFGIGVAPVARVGQRVQIAGLYRGELHIRLARIAGINVPVSTGQKLLTENLVLNVPLSVGNWGGAVLDEQGNLIGMILMSGEMTTNGSGMAISIALPVETISRMLNRIEKGVNDIALGKVIETYTPQNTVEFTPAQNSQDEEVFDKTIWTPTPVDIPDAVASLRSRAAAGYAEIQNFIAKECLTQKSKPSVCYEVRMVKGTQTFRQFERKDLAEEETEVVPPPSQGVWTTADWGDSLLSVAENDWIFRGAVEGGYLFSHSSSAEDERCSFEEISNPLTPIFTSARPKWEGWAACDEQILTDKDFTPIVLIKDMAPPEVCRTEDFYVETRYEWLPVAGIASPILLPAKQTIIAKIHGYNKLWNASITWSEYRRFRAEHKISFTHW